MRARVVDGDGRPLAGVWVWAEPADPGRWPRQDVWQPRFRAGRTDAQGWIELPRAAGERLAVHAITGGAVLASCTGSEPERVLEADARALPRVLELAGPGAVLVRAGPLAWPVGILEAGRALAFQAPADAPVTLWLVTSEARRHVAEMPAAAGRDAPRRVSPPPVERISSRLLDAASRRPLAGALVWLGADPGVFTHTDADGRYRLTAPASGRFWLQAEAAGHRPRAAWIAPEQAAAGRGPTLSLTAAAEVRGRVLDVAGQPLPEARLAVLPGRRPATSHAAFRLDPAESRASFSSPASASPAG